MPLPLTFGSTATVRTSPRSDHSTCRAPSPRCRRPELGHPELLDRLVERDEVLLQQDASGVGVDETLDLRDVGGAGPRTTTPRAAVDRRAPGEKSVTAQLLSSGGPCVPASTTTALAVNLLLLGVFAVQHNVMARPAFKRWWTRMIPMSVERSTYVLLASAALVLLFWQWRTMPAVVWDAAWRRPAHAVGPLRLHRRGTRSVPGTSPRPV